MRKHNTNGFTLIELMAVIVVLGVLSAAAVPMYLGYRDDARRAEARGVIAAIVTAEHFHYQANGTWTDDWTVIRNRIDIEEEILVNWEPPNLNTSGDGFNITIEALSWKNRQDQPLEVELEYDYINSIKTWKDDTGMLQTSTS